MVLRYLYGFRGDALTNGAVFALAWRSGAEYAVVAVNYIGSQVSTTLPFADASTELFEVSTGSATTTSGAGALAVQLAPNGYEVLVNQLK